MDKVNENKELIEKLSNKGLIIVYPDGDVESVDVDPKLIYHSDYYEKLREASPRITYYCNDETFANGNHNEIERELVENGCAVIINWDIRNELKKDEISELYFMLPLPFWSDKQIEITRSYITAYPEIKRYLNMWDKEQERCASTYDNIVLEEMDKVYEEMKEEREKKLW